MMNESRSTVPRGLRTKRNRRLWLFKLVSILIGIGAGIVAAEMGLRLVEKARLRDRAPTIVSDPILGTRILPNTSGHDANGFRNASVPLQVDIVTLGDSQTWGVNVHSYDAWPQQLAGISGASVYNLSLAGYGPVQYWVLTDKALAMSPKTIVVGLYLGNDLYDAYAMVYAMAQTRDNYKQLRDSQRADDELRQDTIAANAQVYWDEEKNFHDSYGRSSPLGWSIWLREHTAIGRLLNRKGWWPGSSDVDYEIDVAWAHTYPEHGAVCDEPGINTVFTPAYRLTGLDLGEPRVVEGLRITKEMLSRTQQQTRNRNVRLIVLMIPTKELVYAERMRDRGLLTGTYARVVQMESSARDELLAWCGAVGMKCLDPVGEMRKQMAEGKRIYPSSTESHPNVAGYGVLANFVSKAVETVPR